MKGGRLAFVSDRSGSENLWVAATDGTDARAVTAFDDDTVLTSPAWSADGGSIFVGVTVGSLFEQTPVAHSLKSGSPKRETRTR